MKLKVTLLLATASVMQFQAQTTNPAPYCASAFVANYNMVQDVKVNGTVHNVGPAGGPSNQNTYMYFNNITFPNIPVSSNASISVGFYAAQDMEPGYFAVWIDFNNNNTFDASEMVMTNSNTTNTYLPTFTAPTVTASASVFIPGNITPGVKRMRIVRSPGPALTFMNYPYSSTVTPDACNSLPPSGYVPGCTYDYSLNITAAANPTTPVANFMISANSICAGNSITATDLSANAPTTWTWVATGAANPLSTMQNPTLVYNTPGTYTIGLVAANAFGTSALTTQTLTVVANPNVTLSTSTATLCSGKTATLTASGAANYTWSTNSTANFVTVSPTVTTTYSVTGSIAGGCNGTSAKTITVIAGPAMTVATTATTICKGKTATLTASGAASYTWNTNSTASLIAVSPTITTTYSVTGQNTSGCTGTAVRTISVSLCIGISENELSGAELEAYPNPANGTFFVSLSREAQPGASINVYNSMGQMILTQDAKKTNVLHLENQAAGLYYVILTEEGFISNRIRVINQK